jgi:hypothetical protein
VQSTGSYRGGGAEGPGGVARSSGRARWQGEMRCGAVGNRFDCDGEARRGAVDGVEVKRYAVQRDWRNCVVLQRAWTELKPCPSVPKMYLLILAVILFG